MTYHYVSRTKLKNKIEYTAKIASDYFSKDDSGFDGLSIDTGYRFFELFNKGFYFLCDVSGNIVNPSYDRISSDSYSSYPRWYSQPHYYGKISVGLAGEDAEQLSSDPVLNWMFESGEDNVWANATPFQRFRNRVMHIYSNIQPDSSDSMGNNKLGQPIPKMLDQFDNGIREVTGDLAVALTAIDAASL